MLSFKTLCYVLSMGMAEDALTWAVDLKLVLKNKPCESAESKFDLTKVLLAGDAKATWLNKKKVITAKITTVKEGDVSKEVPLGICSRSYSKTLRDFLATFFGK